LKQDLAEKINFLISDTFTSSLYKLTGD